MAETQEALRVASRAEALRQPGRQESFLTYSTVSKDHSGLCFPRPFLGGGKGVALLEPWPQRLLRRHRGLWSGHTGYPRQPQMSSRWRISTKEAGCPGRCRQVACRLWDQGEDLEHPGQVGSEESKAQRSSKCPSTDYELKPRYYAVVLLINSYYSHCNYKGGQVEWARPAVDSFLGNLGQAHAHVQRKTVPLPRCSKTYRNLSWRFPDTNRQPKLIGVRESGQDAKGTDPPPPRAARWPQGAPRPGPRRRLEAGCRLCKFSAGREPPPARIKAQGGAPHRSRCLPGAGRALLPRARPLPALAARGLPSELPASPWSALLLGPRAPSTSFLRGNPGAGASAVPSQGPGQVASPRGQFVPRPSAIESERNCVLCARAGSKKTGNMSEFWLISAPGDKENLQALERMNTVTSKSNLSYNTKFTIPDFKVGTLDSLVGLSDELAKLDIFAESLIRRMAQSVVEVMEDAKGKVQENLLANGVDLTSFVTHFEWDMAKYPAKQPLVSVVDTLAKQLAQIETDLKSRTAAYNTLKTNLENLEKKSMGNLFTRTLSDIVSKEDFVLDSEYLITLLVIVPKPSYVQWQKTYESLSDMVVPRSTKLIAEDKEGGLFTVTLFRKVIDDFKTKAKENKFMVREFYYDEKEIKREREEMTRLLSDKKQQYQTSCVALKKGSSTLPDHKVKVTPLGNPDRPAAGQSDRERESEGEGEGPLLRWLKVNFSEAFIAWIHIKALRVFVESVLRYGLPVNFQAVLLRPHKKSCTKRLREVLNSVFRHLDEVAAASILDASVEIPGLQLSNQDYFPYVYFHIDLSLLD
ncbi:hypothetical protein R6Z07M_003877 [Ovis aries]